MKNNVIKDDFNVSDLIDEFRNCLVVQFKSERQNIQAYTLIENPQFMRLSVKTREQRFKTHYAWQKF